MPSRAASTDSRGRAGADRRLGAGARGHAHPSVLAAATAPATSRPIDLEVRGNELLLPSRHRVPPRSEFLLPRLKRLDRRELRVAESPVEFPPHLLFKEHEPGRREDLLLQHAQDDVFEELARIVELRFFGGLSIEETARVLASSTASVTRGWRVARKGLVRELDGADD